MSKQSDMYNDVCAAHIVVSRFGAIVDRARSIDNTLCVVVGSGVTLSVSASAATDDKELLEAALRMQAAFAAFNASVTEFVTEAARANHTATVAMYAKIGACAFEQ